MIHRDIEEKIFNFYDSEFSDEDRRMVTAHTQTCPACRELLLRAEKITTGLSRAGMPESSERFVNSVMARIQNLESQVRAPEKRRASSLEWLFPALGYALAFALMFFVISEREPAVNTGEVLLADVPQETQWTFSKEPPEIYKLMGIKEDL